MVVSEEEPPDEVSPEDASFDVFDWRGAFPPVEDAGFVVLGVVAAPVVVPAEEFSEVGVLVDGVVVVVVGTPVGGAFVAGVLVVGGVVWEEEISVTLARRTDAVVAAEELP
jgi:hypothetical protein